jgi:hypothetical protein
MPKPGPVAGLYQANIARMTLPVVAAARARASLGEAGFESIAAYRGGLARGP